MEFLVDNVHARETGSGQMFYLLFLFFFFFNTSYETGLVSSYLWFHISSYNQLALKGLN